MVVEADSFLEDDMIWATDDEGVQTKKTLRAGVTSGASTPDKEVQEALSRIVMLDDIFAKQKSEDDVQTIQIY